MLEPHSEALSHWPASGRHILAQFDATTIVVYQAFRPSIAAFAVREGRFGGDFRLGRMSWVKPNFLWMMYRSGWATKPGQERVLAVRLPRAFFDDLLRRAVPSQFDAERFATHEAWKEAVRGSDVRLQWDPDHDPAGRPLERRAIQLGLRGETLRRYAKDEPVAITDVTEFVAAERPRARAEPGQLRVPVERVYVPGDIVEGVFGRDGSPSPGPGTVPR